MEVLSVFYIDIGHFSWSFTLFLCRISLLGEQQNILKWPLFFFPFLLPTIIKPCKYPRSHHVTSRPSISIFPFEMQIINFFVVFISFLPRGGWAMDSWFIWHAFVYLFDFLPLYWPLCLFLHLHYLVVLVFSSSSRCFASQLSNPFGPRLCIACPVLSRTSRSLQMIPWKRPTKIDIEAGLPWELARTRNWTKRERWDQWQANRERAKGVIKRGERAGKESKSRRKRLKLNMS